MDSWPHSPAHWLFTPGLYMVTAGTYEKRAFFDTAPRRDLVMASLLSIAAEFGWGLQAWAVFANHYHFIAQSPTDPQSLRKLLTKLHANTARALNKEGNVTGRKVWFQYWDSHLTFERSYLARLNYVHHNPVKHGLVTNAQDYPWCSAAWFAENSPVSFRATVESFKTDQVNVPDDF
jgi:putative transposase